MKHFEDKILQGDCIKELSKAKKPFADLIFADPPYNIKKAQAKILKAGLPRVLAERLSTGI